MGNAADESRSCLCRCRNISAGIIRCSVPLSSPANRSAGLTAAKSPVWLYRRPTSTYSTTRSSCFCTSPAMAKPTVIPSPTPLTSSSSAARRSKRSGSIRLRTMSSSPSPDSSTAEARKALGWRLRQIRRSRNVTARALSALIHKHHTSISKIENGVKQPTESDVIAWCRACDADDQVADILATLRAVETAYIEWKRSARAGLRRLGRLHGATSYDATSTFRVHEPTVLPGFLQTEQYIRDALRFWYDFLDVPDDIDEVVEFKLD